MTGSDFSSGLSEHRRLFRKSSSYGGYADGVCISRIVPPAIGARLLRERWALAVPKYRKSDMPAIISRIIAAKFSF